MATSSRPNAGERSHVGDGLNAEGNNHEETMCYEDGDKEQKTEKKPKKSSVTPEDAGSVKSDGKKSPVGTNHPYTQCQIDSFTSRVLAMERSLENSEKSDSDRPAGQQQKGEQGRVRSPSVPNTLTLGVPEGYGEGVSPSGSRRPLSPLLEIRRPHCTLNCENCKTILEEQFRHRIIENVKNGQKPSFRPIVDDLYREDPSSREVISLMKRCWGEEPADRPDFTALKSHISKLNK
ncbi:UNVERIFIED_CONTAM: hypothetical protein PYX00_007132 [Menopon gallinae]|uniref:Uncharacterized protein n=1 Tax=Menopon gallinae TaxID=328185 RepID=A0AAW2HIK1_9NEOP